MNIALLKDRLQAANLPPLPELPKYDPNEEPSKWSWERERWGLPNDRTNWTGIGTQPASPDMPDWRGVIKNNVIELPLPGAYKFGQPVKRHYFWFDTPDYADPFKKLWYSFKWFTYTGLLGSCVNGMWECKKFTMANHLWLAKTTLVPWVFGGMAASFTVLILANLRGKKDDYYNYLAAGLVLGSVMGRQNHIKWWRNTVVLTPAAVYVKYAAETNVSLMPTMNIRGLYRNSSLEGNDAEHGVLSGDLRFGVRSSWGEPGRDVRTY